MFDVVAIGEVLWDIILPSRPPSVPPNFGEEGGWGVGGVHLGGAPFNFAAQCHHLGAHSTIISRVGQDELGDEIIVRAQYLNVDTSLVQRDAEHPTGQVHVTLDADARPEFDICTEVAYDYLAVNPEAVARVQDADIVCFGTLAQRHPVARQSIVMLLEAARQQPFDKSRGTARDAVPPLLVCDLNLRPPHYSAEVVCDSLARCHLLKLNGDELRLVQEMLGRDDGDDDQFLLHLLDTYGLELVCVTLGARGCILRTCRERVVAPGYLCQAVDTVGSGDAFTAALVVQYLAGQPLADVADFANLVGAYVATQSGAVPPIRPDALERFAAQSRRIMDNEW
ncbi:MAG: carbohydrate kinase [Chloroflexota bacterium]|nr:carbohydrate kinase [Chloroflexota bacterium]